MEQQIQQVKKLSLAYKLASELLKSKLEHLTGDIMGAPNILSSKDQTTFIYESFETIITGNPAAQASSPSSHQATSTNGTTSLSAEQQTQARSMASDPSGSLGAPSTSLWNYSTKATQTYDIQNLDKPLNPRMLSCIEQFSADKPFGIAFELFITFKDGKPSEIRLKSDDLTPEQRTTVLRSVAYILQKSPIHEEEGSFHRIYTNR